MKRKRTMLTAAAAVVLIIAFAAAAVALRGPAKQEGTYHRDVLERVCFTVENTDFTVEKETDGAEDCTLRFTLRAQKTEADFYAVIHSVRVEGLDYARLTVQGANAQTVNPPEELALPAENGTPTELAWDADVLFTAAEAGDTDFELVIRFTSGITPQTADEHILRVPMRLHVNAAE